MNRKYTCDYFITFLDIVDKCEQIDDLGGIMSNIKAAAGGAEDHQQ